MDKKHLILSLYKMGAIKFGRFTLKSGQLSPVYLNLREIISHPELLKAVAELLWEKIKGTSFDLICGVPYTALPIATCLSLEHKLPMLIRRKEQKAYGTKQKIEGLFKAGQNCLIIEDVVTSGSSILETAQDLEEVGLKVSHLAVLIDREQGGQENLAQKKYQMHAVLTLSEVLETLAHSELLTEAETTIVSRLLAEQQASRQRLSYSERISFCKNSLAKNLFSLMESKKTNLALSADLTSARALLELADRLGPEICVLKTHIDILEDFSEDFTHQLRALAQKHQFLIFEDRKFADIGHTVKEQYQGGLYHIAQWADIINAHSLPGLPMITSLAEIGLKNQRGLLLVAEMSSAHNLLDAAYTEKTLALAKQCPEFVMGFIAQKKLAADPQWLYLTPGVHLASSGDQRGQQYVTPQQAILERSSDLIIVGRGIWGAKDPLAAAKEYRAAGWQAYQAALAKTTPAALIQD